MYRRRRVTALYPTGEEILARSPRAYELVSRAIKAGVHLDGTYLVGGAVRDALLNVDASTDIDIAVEGDALTFAGVIASALGGDVITAHEAFGTATIKLDLGASLGNISVDVAGCRTELYSEPGALPIVTLGAAIEQDLLRRDFTINAIAVELSADVQQSLRVVDPRGGLVDLFESRSIRVLHDASFEDDPTRIFRLSRYGGRFSGRGGLRIDPHTRQLAVDATTKGALATISAQRMRSELELILSERAFASLTYLSSWGVLDLLDPRLEAVFHPPHLIASIDEACASDTQRHARSWILRLATLAQMVGDDAVSWLRWIGFPSSDIDRAVELAKLLDAVLNRAHDLQGMPNSELYLEFGELSDEALALAALASIDAHPDLISRLISFMEVVVSTQLTVRGDDVIKAGVPAGPRVGRILGDLFLRTLDGELNGVDDEFAAIAKHLDVASEE